MRGCAVAAWWIAVFTTGSPVAASLQQPDEVIAKPTDAAASAWAGDYVAELGTPGGALPFGLEIRLGGEGVARAVLVNGPERIDVPDVTITSEVCSITIEPYAARLELTRRADGTVHGTWRKPRGAGRRVEMALALAPARGRTRFARTRSDEPQAAIASRYRVQFSKDEHPAVGVFEQGHDGMLHGTFLTTLGDYRYLAGVVDGSSLKLSCFDGAHAFLFKAEQAADGSLRGDFWSADAWHETWAAVPDPNAALPDAFALTRWGEEADTALGRLRFPDLDGVERGLADPEFVGAARVLQVFGSWCPNCNDASAYLAELDGRYRDQGLRILGLAFEHSGEPARDAQRVRAYLDRHGADYPVLLAGPSDKKSASAALPLLDRVRSYPTTIFLDRAGALRGIYTGFSGPATGADHARLRERFEALIEELLAADQKLTPKSIPTWR